MSELAARRCKPCEGGIPALTPAEATQLLAHGAGPVSRLAQRGLAWVNRSQELRRFFIRRALGLSGELPEAAR